MECLDANKEAAQLRKTGNMSSETSRKKVRKQEPKLNLKSSYQTPHKLASDTNDS